MAITTKRSLEPRFHAFDFVQADDADDDDMFSEQPKKEEEPFTGNLAISS